MACGEPHPDLIINKLTSKQLTECIAYNTVEPFGHDTQSFLIGQLTAILYNINKGKNASSKNAWDFVPFIRVSGKKQKPETIKELLMGLVKETDPTKPKEPVKRISQTRYQKKRMRLLREQQEQRRKQ